ncbi:MAG TPA: ABC transporter permease, partial [Clostridiales bacterium]|nr:ABC transporter permease [Clostridiales bacterium]
MNKVKTMGKLYTFLILLFLYAPIFILVLFSFNASHSTSVLSGFSLRWYKELMYDNATLEALKNTIVLAVSSSVLATLIGT